MCVCVCVYVRARAWEMMKSDVSVAYISVDPVVVYFVLLCASGSRYV